MLFQLMNSSILAILLTSICFFILNLIFLLIGIKKLSLVFQICVTLIITFAIYLCLHGRAALTGLSAGVVYLIFKELKFPRFFILKAAAFLIIVLVVVIFSIKKDSSHGRILVYKVVFSQLKPKDYFIGLGIGKFKVKYNKLQAAYFEHNDRNSKEALLAGNGYYLFNDWLQFVLEIGVLGLALICCFLAFFFRIFYWLPKNKPVLHAANCTLICISTAALFSYPLQVPVTFFFFLICLSIHLYYSYAIRGAYNNKYFRRALYTTIGFITLISTAYFFLVYQYKLKSKAAFELSRDGFKDEADSMFKKLMHYPFADYNMHYNYAYMLYFKNEISDALLQINKSLDLAYSAEGVKLKADILWELNNVKEAEFFYKQAVYITPGRMLPKFNLLQFYIKTKQMMYAKYWANDILTMPIKIPSEMTANIQSSVKEMSKKW